MVLQGVLKRVFKGDLEGYLEEDLEVDYEGNSKWDCIGDFKLDLEEDLLSGSGQVWSRSGSFYSSNLILLSFRAGLCQKNKFPDSISNTTL